MTIASDTSSAEIGRRSKYLYSDKEVQIHGGTVTQLSALAVAIAEQQPDEWSALGR
jgi:hypothetical protein